MQLFYDPGEAGMGLLNGISTHSSVRRQTEPASTVWTASKENAPVIVLLCHAEKH
jgi:hypothetical protein